MQPQQWKRRQVEKQLAQDLHEALAEYRVAVFRANDVASTISAASAGDGDLQLRQSQAECDRARAKLETAQTRWAEFVRGGVIPPDLDHEF